MKPNFTHTKSKITFLLLAFFVFSTTVGYAQTYTLLPGSSVLEASGTSSNGKVNGEYAWLDSSGNLQVAFSLVVPANDKTPSGATYNGLGSLNIDGPFTANLKIGTTINRATPTTKGAWIVANFGRVSLSDPFIIGINYTANGYDVVGLSVALVDYTVTYNANGGSGVMNDSSNPYLENATVTILSNVFTRVGHTFTGYNTKADGTGTPYQSGATFTMPAADVVLFAQWTLSCTNPTAGGTTAAAQTICSGGDPAAFTSSIAASGQTGGTLDYKWQSSTTSSSLGFSDIIGATSLIYDVPAGLTQTTWYKRLAKVSCKTDWSGAAESNVVEVTVKPIPTLEVTNASVCNGTAATITATGTATGGTYLWSTGATTASITVSPSTTTEYTVVYTLNGCPSLEAKGTVTVKPIPTLEVTNASVCNGT
ncbi:InlB B-repeat-containing protein, partial [uncultured Flavobacterium sp.]|uniref:InlB B-repeat-containing protein n=1 Tax=uncultured Flavobacterium sp. TaxID=165435 RepID=UPI0030ECB464